MAYRTCEGSVNSIFSVICFGNEFLRFVSPSRHSLHQRPQRPAELGQAILRLRRDRRIVVPLY